MVVLMVVKEEACCPKCFTYKSFIVPLVFDESTAIFSCPHDNSHQFVEDEEGFLQSKG
ncbi:MAG: hypothetical protein V1835_01070 [Candidatus Micrarchaeota archaeon]